MHEPSSKLKIRPAAIADTKTIVDLIKELAIYEKLGAVAMDEWTVFRVTSDKFGGLLK